MKLASQAIEKNLRQLDPGLKAMLVFGPDAALVRARAESIARQIVADPQDIFRIEVLNTKALQDDIGLLDQALNGFSLNGGRRLVLLENPSETLANALAQAVGEHRSDTFLLIRAGDLPPGSKLRAAAEKSSIIGAMACYAESVTDLSRLLQNKAQQAGYQLDKQAALALVEASGGERDCALQELEKLMLYVHASASVLTLEDVHAISASVPGQSLDLFQRAVLTGHMPHILQGLSQLAEQGIQGIPLLYSVQNRLWQLEQAYGLLESIGSLEASAEKILGKMAWKEKPAFLELARFWTPKRLRHARKILHKADLMYRHLPVSGDMLVADTLLSLKKQVSGAQ
jgi:DNA polymerase-3 subunit delta